MDEYYQDIRQYRKILPKAEIFRLIRLWQNKQDYAARDKIIRHNLRLVVSIANKCNRTPERHPMEDMIAFGNCGLIKVLDKFNPDLGFAFSTYATFWIRQAIQHGMESNRVIHIPTYIQNHFKYIQRILNKLMISARPIHDDEVVDRMIEQRVPCDNIDDADDSDHACYLRRLIYCRSVVAYRRTGSVSPLLGDWKSGDTSFHEDWSYLRDAVGILSPRQRFVIEARFLFSVYEGQPSLAEVGRRINLTRERVRQIQIEALAILRRHLGKQQAYTSHRDTSGVVCSSESKTVCG